MLRLVRSAWRAADRFVQHQVTTTTNNAPSKLKSISNVFVNLKSTSAAHASAHAQHASVSPHLSKIPPYGHRSPPVQSNFTFATRLALSRPFGSPHLPRPPVVPRSVTQVGLGTARNFSSTRHVFQNLVENVPLTTRAMWEAEWDMKKRKMEKMKAARRVQRAEAAKAKPIADKAKPVDVIASPVSSTSSIEDEEEQFAKYFKPTEVLVEGVKTHLTIPLYPSTPRTPLEPAPQVDESGLLPGSLIKSIHDAFSLHRARVSSIFHRLDAENVWSRGAVCDTYGPQFAVTSLQVTFNGWTKAMVLEVIGEAGKGWCDIEEESIGPKTPGLSTAATTPTEPEMDFPTLDFSSGFLAHTEPYSHIPDVTSDAISPFMSRASSPTLSDFVHEETEGWSSGDEGYTSPNELHMSMYSPGSDVSLGFSVDFMAREERAVAGQRLFEPF
ncbi:hypothetical protein FRB99_006252 [Tulasnella sp. 403]|nr:hypothetical protein FRB99_006252 [Tulasnella sp. 403]